jgi:hypothetical protein
LQRILRSGNLALMQNESTSYRRIERVITHIDRHRERQPDGTVSAP